MSYKLIELRPNRNLLDANFESFLLSLEKIPMLQKELQKDQKPNEKKPSDKQFSFLHAQIFGLHNHLIRDAYFAYSAYFVSANLKINKVEYNKLTGNLEEIKTVFTIPKPQHVEKTGDYNLTVKFISEIYCLISDGVGSLLLVETGDRSKKIEWKCTSSLILKAETNQLEQFLIKDGRLDLIDGKEHISVLLQHIQYSDPKFYNVLNWMIFVKDAKTNFWTQTSNKELRAAGELLYSAIEPNCKAILLASDQLFKFSSASSEANGILLIPKSQFEWCQTDEFVIIKFSISRTTYVNVNDYKIEFLNKKLSVSYKDDILLEKELYESIDPESIKKEYGRDNQLQLILIKEKSLESWPYLYIDAPTESLELRSETNKVEEPSFKTANTFESLEDCDFSENDAEYFIERLDGETMLSTHRINLGNTSPLFNVTLQPGLPDAIVLRHDVDGLVWCQDFSNCNNWNFRHEGTLNAFGYIMCSKKQRKYISCAPNMNYSIISESKRHIFLYQNKHDGASGLKNRNGEKFSFGQQKLITLDGKGEIIGIVCENDVTFILTEKYLICLQINTE